MLRRALVILLSFCSLVSALAEPVSNLYDFTVNISNHSQSNIHQAFQSGLSGVLVKVSGNPSAITLPKIQSALNQAGNYVQSYDFSKDSNDKPQIVIHFDRQGIQTILESAGQAIWHRERPLTLVWLVDSQQQQVITSADVSAMKTAIVKTAQDRGIPIIFPLMDLEDQSIDNNQSLTAKEATQLTQRYHADGILVGHTKNLNGDLLINWQYLYHDQPNSWANRADNYALAATAGINQTADILANQLAMIDDDNLQTSYTLAVSNVHDLHSFTQLIALVKKLTIVNRVNIKDMSNDNVILQINTAANSETLNRDLSIYPQLKASSTRQTPPNTLLFNWQASPSKPPPLPVQINTSDNSAQ